MERISLGLAGTGVAAEYHASAVSLSDHYQMLGAFSRGDRRAKEFAFRHGISKTFNDIEYLFEGCDLDLLVVATETSRHLSLGMDALTKGLGLIVEAPLCLNQREAKAMVEEAEESGTFLLEANPILALPGFQKMQETIVSGALGTLQHVSLTMCRNRGENYLSPERWQGRREEAGGGILMQEGYLGLSALVSLLGKAKVLSSHLQDCMTEGVENSASLVLAFQAVEATVEISCVRSGKAFLLEVIGSKGKATLDGEAFFLGERPSLESKEAFNPYRHLYAEYQRFLRFLEGGEDLSGEFQRILHTFALLEEIQR